MLQKAQITGTVTYRDGDGPGVNIRPGPCEIEDLGDSVNITWTDDEGEHSQSVPKSNYSQYIKNGDLELTEYANS
jgi:hypothetical protein